MTVSVLIPCLNEEKYISTILTDLSRQTRVADEIIVVDGYSSDTTQTIVSGFKGVQLFVHGPGVALQRNVAASHATGELLIFLDADTHITENFIESVIADFKQHTLDMAIPRYIPFQSKWSYELFFLFFNALFFLFQKILPSGAGCGVFIRRSVFEKYGGFNGSLTYDDIELIRRIGRRARFQIVPITVYVSDRRLRKYGLFHMIVLYFALSILFCLNQFKLANKIKYEFGRF